MLTPAQRSLRARKAAHLLHAQYDSRELTAPGRAVFLARFERQVDPEGILPLEERRRRAEHLKRAYFLDLAAKSVKSRQAKKARS